VEKGKGLACSLYGEMTAISPGSRSSLYFSIRSRMTANAACVMPTPHTRQMPARSLARRVNSPQPNNRYTLTTPQPGRN
jgi:hypothetical protein